MKKIYRVLTVFLCFILISAALPISADYDYDPNRMIKAYAKRSGYSQDDIIIEEDLGRYGGWLRNRVVILGIKGEEKDDKPYDLYIGQLCFRFSSAAYADRFLLYTWDMYYEPGFMTVKESYEMGILDSEDIYEMAIKHGVDTYSPEELTVNEDGIEWRFDPVTGKLTVEGNGNMPDYKVIDGKSTSPSSRWRYDIRELEVNIKGEIGNNAFYNCENLTKAKITKAFGIGEKAFYNCKKLFDIEFYRSLRTIGRSAFEGCSSLTEIVFPAGIREITDSAFKGCNALEKMSFNGKAPKLYSGMLTDFKGEVLYPENSEFWTSEICKSYSQTAKWIPFEASGIGIVENYFEDLHPGGWYLSGIQYCYAGGYMEGMGNYRFDPNAPLTREQVAMVMYKYLRADETYTRYSFKDVVPGAWYADAVEWMYQKGYTKGVGNDMYGVGRPVTRQDLMTLVYNAVFRDYEIQYFLADYYIKGGINSFSDVDGISYYAYDAMRLAVEVCDSSMCRGPGEIKPILYGDDGMLRPRDTCTRAEAAAIFERSIQADYFSPVSNATPPSS
ncbi:MAG: S-layer homology domain-containing protein [Clostridia bacterium]|nr:S-layer homology domain-containing protein [Clostridia bacterium]